MTYVEKFIDKAYPGLFSNIQVAEDKISWTLKGFDSGTMPVPAGAGPIHIDTVLRNLNLCLRAHIDQQYGVRNSDAVIQQAREAAARHMLNKFCTVLCSVAAAIALAVHYL